MNPIAGSPRIWLVILGLSLGMAKSFADPFRLAGMANSEWSGDLESLLLRSIGSATNAAWTNRLQSTQVAATLVNLTDPGQLRWASYRGQALVYPASVVKLFYLAAAHRWMEDGKLQDTPELRRALKDMIVESYNEATHYVVDLLTGTTSGPELPDTELREWQEKRNAVNRYYRSLGYPNINANKKPWCEGPYGREMQATKTFEPRRNFLTTEVTARLLTEIALGKSVTPGRSHEMMELLQRDPASPTSDRDDQAHGFTGLALKPGMKLWSKAGWTSETRHDAAYIELPNHTRIVLVIFTTDHAEERSIIPAVASPILRTLGQRE